MPPAGLGAAPPLGPSHRRFGDSDWRGSEPAGRQLIGSQTVLHFNTSLLARQNRRCDVYKRRLSVTLSVCVFNIRKVFRKERSVPAGSGAVTPVLVQSQAHGMEALVKQNPIFPKISIKTHHYTEVLPVQ